MRLLSSMSARSSSGWVGEGLIGAWGLTGIGHPDTVIKLLGERPAPAAVRSNSQSRRRGVAIAASPMLPVNANTCDKPEIDVSPGSMHPAICKLRYGAIDYPPNWFRDKASGKRTSGTAP